MRALLLAVFTLAACAAQPEPPPPAETPVGSELAQQIRADLAHLDGALEGSGVFVAGLGETANLGGGLSVRPLEVIEDSRCPRNVQCVWAGRLRLRAEVSGAVRELTLGEPLETRGGVLLFAIASPNAWAQWPEAEVPRPAYRFGFRRE